MVQQHSSHDFARQRERLLRLLAATTFLIFFQAYMVAPMIPKLSAVFGVSPRVIGLIVPAYLIPYGVSTLFYGLLSDWIGRRRIILASLFAFVLLSGLTATAHSASQLIVWRLATGLGASGVVPLALALNRRTVPIRGAWSACGMAVWSHGRRYGFWFYVRCPSRTGHWLARVFLTASWSSCSARFHDLKNRESSSLPSATTRKRS